MNEWKSLIISIILHLLIINTDAQCPCIRFNQTGRFHSPDYPKRLEAIKCLLFHFVAPPKHIVRLTFDFFSLPPKSESRCSSGIWVWESSTDGLIDPFLDIPDEIFCAKDLQNGEVLHSVSRHFIFAIKTEIPSAGFNGEYQFIPRANLTSDALQTAECAFRVEREKGTIFSPRYPYHPQAHSNCSYLFPERKGLSLTIASISLQLAPLSLIDIYELRPQKVLVARESHLSDSLFIHSQHSVLINFSAGPKNKRKTGFRLEYSYGKLTPSPEMPSLSFDTSFSECSLQISSKNGKQGKLNSNQLSSRSSSLPSKCIIIFEGEQNEKVSVKFTYFNLYAPEHANTTKRCAEFDHLTAAVRVGTRFSRIDTWCSKDRPPQLMSSSNILQMEYNTRSSRAVRESATQEIGFRLEYSFHSDWNMNEMEAQYDSSRGCRFVFNSSKREAGKLWSINYPGLYPRNLHCEYIFHGREDQIVHIHFEYFDVEGFNQCDEQSQSDFVLFSNYQSPDRNNRRVCGKNLPRISTMSESNYYRMVFSTNEIFDATGFFAHYQFLSAQQTPTISKVKFTPSSVSSIFISIPMLLCLLFIFIN